ncbi:peptide deformylase [Methylobacterium pseudosasicola]|uniref:Peptide deformylase-like n=1 Tax=Methylobacterium pseudosasicola TaxID=582667 RepID=A0A1I4J374_9HYPH|nr:peptide deformylase [Methylobacterium pseudosasicola]SFL61024.1 peptide deformylase [Methylobacterium pseudosasicola]
MPARPLVLFPDPRLSLPAAPTDAFGSGLKALANDVRDTLLAASAIGLTAPHIGVPERIMVIRLSPDEDLRVYMNPKILWASPETSTHDEGSVSMPGVRERITRPTRIRFGFRDLDGAAHEEEVDGFEAAVVQHEIDQLDGIFWIDRLSRLKRDRLLKRFGKLKSASS